MPPLDVKTSMRVEQILLLSLENLTEEDFKKFKDTLANMHYGKKQNITLSKLEKASILETKNLLKSHYGIRQAIDVVIKVFKDNHLMENANRLKEEKKKAIAVSTSVTKKMPAKSQAGGPPAKRKANGEDNLRASKSITQDGRSVIPQFYGESELPTTSRNASLMDQIIQPKCIRASVGKNKPVTTKDFSIKQGKRTSPASIGRKSTKSTGSKTTSKNANKTTKTKSTGSKTTSKNANKTTKTKPTVRKSKLGTKTSTAKVNPSTKKRAKSGQKK